MASTSKAKSGKPKPLPQSLDGLPLSNGVDQGEVSIAIGVRNDQVIMQFGRAVAWIGMTRTDAVKLAKLLLQYAQQQYRD